MTQSNFDPMADIPVVRGRRDPSITAALEAEDPMADPGQQVQTYVGMRTGDTLVAKVSLAIPSEMGEAWFTYGGTTTIGPGENEEEAFARLGDVVNTRVLDLADDALTRVHDTIEAQRQAARTNRITPR